MSDVQEEHGIDEPLVVEPTGGSLMEQLRARHQEIASATTVDLQLPGYDDLLVVRYKVLDVKSEINAISQRVAKSKASQLGKALNAALDTMIAACVEVYTTIDGELRPLAESFGPDAVPVKFDEQLAEFMGFTDVHGSRDTIMALFGGNEPMVMQHAQLLSRWMSNTTKDVDSDFLSEM